MFAKITILGKISNNIELKYSSDGSKTFANFGVYVYTKSGEFEYTDFFDCVCFGKAAEILNQYFYKGSPICVNGILRQERWCDNYGNNRSKIKVIVNELHFVPVLSEKDSQNSANNNSQKQNNNANNQAKKPQNKPQKQAQNNSNNYSDDYNDYAAPSDDFSDEIPF